MLKGRAVALIAFTQQGCELAKRLAEGLGSRGATCTVSGPARFAASCGIAAYDGLGAWTARHFAQDDALVFVGATGIAVRAIAPHVRDKFTDPAVVSVDERGGYAVPLLSGHVGAANDCARTIAALTGGNAVISTATDVNGLFAVDEWATRRGCAIVERTVAKEVSARLLEGGCVGSAVDPELLRLLADGPDGSASEEGVFADVPAAARCAEADLGFAVTLNDDYAPFARTLHLVPRVVSVGVGCRKGTDPQVLARAVDEALAAAQLSHAAVAELSTIDVKRGEEAIAQLAAANGWPVRYLSAAELAAVPGTFATSSFVAQTVGVDNVCERAAVARGGRLVVGKQAHDGVTVAIALHAWPAVMDEGNEADMEQGKLQVVGLGPGGAQDLTRRAYDALRACDLIVGYTVYVDLLREEFADKEMLTTPMRQEIERCKMALEKAVEGRTVAMVCSGDPGVYGMAGLILELAGDYPGVDIEVIPGVSASNGGAAVLGAPLMHDHCLISLSDLMTPWELIERRLAAAAQGDFVVSIYNPSSRKRADYLQRACDIMMAAGKSPETVCGIVRNIGREGEEARMLTLAELRDTSVDMFTTVFVGNSRTREIDGWMVTPRGYLQRGE